MRVRLAVREDMDAVLSLAEQQVAEAVSHLPFERDVAKATFLEAIANGDLALVAEHKGEIVGILLGRMCVYDFCSGIFVNLEVLYVRPDKRGTRAAAVMLLEYIQWGQIVGAREIHLGVNNPATADRVAQMYERLGADCLGYQHRIVLDGQQGREAPAGIS